MRDDEWLSRIGVALTGMLTMAVFLFAVIKLPVRDAVAALQVPSFGAPSSSGKTASHEVTVAHASVKPQPLASVSPTAVPTLEPTAVPTPEPLVVRSAAPAAHASVPPRATPTARKEASSTYTVQSGDTLFSIAKRYGVSAQSLASQNGVSENGLVKVGQQLKVP